LRGLRLQRFSCSLYQEPGMGSHGTRGYSRNGR
jgi:hypothetical protein